MLHLSIVTIDSVKSIFTLYGKFGSVVRYMRNNQNPIGAVKALEHLGLGENEAILYNVLLKHGESTVQELQKFSPFPRTMIYYVLSNLMQRDLVSFIKKTRRTVYIAEDPEKLYDLLHEKEKEFEKNKILLQESIPELKNQFRLSQHRPGVRVFEGIEGYRESLEDCLHSRAERVYSYVHISDKKKPGVEVREEMRLQRSAWGIEEHILLFDTPQAREFVQKNKPIQTIHCRLISQKLEAFDTDVSLYKNKMMYTSYDGREPVILLTEDKHLFEMQKNIFTLLWKMGTEL